MLHYGVKGMKWGVRKEYELKGRKKSSSKPIVTNAVTIKKKTDNGDSTVHINDKKDYENLKWQNIYYKDTRPAIYAPEAEAKEKLANLPRIYIPQGPDRLELATNHDAPNYDRKMNCFECVMASEMRIRGYNVQSNTVPGAYPFEVLHAFDVKDSFKATVSSPSGSYLSTNTLAKECYDRMEERCLSYGDGARGLVTIKYASTDTGHAMSWEVKNGKFQLRDYQAAGRDPYKTFLQCDTEYGVEVYRLDNAEVLPGVTDFVEPYARTEEEQEAAARQREEDEKRRKKNNKLTIAKVIDSIGKLDLKQVGEYISEGMKAIGEVLKNPFKVETRTTVSTHTVWNNPDGTTTVEDWKH